MSTIVSESKNPFPAAFPRAEEAYGRVLPELVNFEGRVRFVNVDVVAVTETAMGVLPKLEAFRDEFSKARPEDAKAFARLGDYLGALYFAHLEHRTNPAPVDAYEALHAEVRRTREILRNDLRACVLRGALDESVFADRRGIRGHRNVVADLAKLVRVFQRNWATLEGKCLTTAADLVTAEALATRALAALGERQQAPAGSTETGRMRARALTLFVDAYNRVRHALGGLRWKEGDADEIMPTLFPRNRKTVRPADVDESSESTDGTTAPPAPAATTATPAVSTAA